VKSEILEKVIEYSRHYKSTTPLEIKRPLTSSVMAEVVPLWDAQFIDLEQGIIFELILAADYLKYKSLLELGCAKIGSMLRGKTEDEIRREFNIEENFTPEEEAQISEENKWAELE